MDSSTPLRETIRRIAELLAAHGENDWAKAFETFADEFEESPGDTKARIRSVCGGMGSFNDIILHGPNGIPLRDENDELDRLRSDLYSMCRT